MFILMLSEFVKFITAIIMFNLFNGILTIHLQRRLTKYSSGHSTRQNRSFVMVQVRTNLKAMCLSVYGVKLWNTFLVTLRIALAYVSKNISYHTIRLIHCNKLYTPLFAIDQSIIMVIYNGIQLCIQLCIILL